MTDRLRAAAQQALKAFEVATTHFAKDRQEILRAEEALRAALAEREVEQEPDAWLYETPMPDGSVFVGASTERLEIGVGVPTGSTERPLYTAPPRREWRGLKDDEINELRKMASEFYGELTFNAAHRFAKWIEDELKERNT